MVSSERRAGSGAEEQARRIGDREAELEAQLAQLRQRRAGWEAGAAGERAVAAVLAELADDGWRVAHDVHWPGRPLANLDHVAVGPGGIVVIDAKNWSGTVTLSDGLVRQNGYRRPHVADDACTAAAAVAAMLAPSHRRHVRTAVCFAQQAHRPTTLPPGAVVLGAMHLAAWLRGLPAVLPPDEVAAVHQYLVRELGGVRSPQQTTTAALETAGPALVVEPSARERRALERRALERRVTTPDDSATALGGMTSRGRRLAVRIAVGAVATLLAVAWWGSGPDDATPRPTHTPVSAVVGR